MKNAGVERDLPLGGDLGGGRRGRGRRRARRALLLGGALAPLPSPTVVVARLGVVEQEEVLGTRLLRWLLLSRRRLRRRAALDLAEVVQQAAGQGGGLAAGAGPSGELLHQLGDLRSPQLGGVVLSPAAVQVVGFVHEEDDVGGVVLDEHALESRARVEDVVVVADHHVDVVYQVARRFDRAEPVLLGLGLDRGPIGDRELSQAPEGAAGGDLRVVAARELAGVLPAGDHVVEAGLGPGGQYHRSDRGARGADPSHRAREDRLLGVLGGRHEHPAANGEGVAKGGDEGGRCLADPRRRAHEDRAALLQRAGDCALHIGLARASFSVREADVAARRAAAVGAGDDLLALGEDCAEALGHQRSAGGGVVLQLEGAPVPAGQGDQAQVERDLGGTFAEVEAGRAGFEQEAVQLQLAGVGREGVAAGRVDRGWGSDDRLHLFDHGPAGVVGVDAVDSTGHHGPPGAFLQLESDRSLAPIRGHRLLARSLVHLVLSAAERRSVAEGERRRTREAVVLGAIRQISHRQGDRPRPLVEPNHQRGAPRAERDSTPLRGGRSARPRIRNWLSSSGLSCFRTVWGDWGVRRRNSLERGAAQGCSPSAAEP